MTRSGSPVWSSRVPNFDELGHVPELVEVAPRLLVDGALERIARREDVVDDPGQPVVEVLALVEALADRVGLVAERAHGALVAVHVVDGARLDAGLGDVEGDARLEDAEDLERDVVAAQVLIAVTPITSVLTVRVPSSSSPVTSTLMTVMSVVPPPKSNVRTKAGDGISALTVWTPFRRISS